jgi:hypothetical protein
MRSLPSLALILLITGCASAPPLTPGVAGTYDLESVDGLPLPSKDNIVNGTLQLRGNRTFTWRFTMQEISEEGERSQLPVVFEGRYSVGAESPAGFLIRLTRRDRASSMSGNTEVIEGILIVDTLTFTSEDLNAVFGRRR